MNGLTSSWYIVLLPAEAASDTEIYGPFRSKDVAQSHADRWNERHGDPQDQAVVLPVRNPALLGGAS
ncbi:hypothetical protein [Kibdelosporangium phytohabitans]|uniref:YCII-related domain-containing protein n=1 Tax=Kibdelosporangium phytohabitans TaxID=860235 RepID=A0A0N7F2U6_9PSEU|nr:hypothetical protein [Kibdelosporangium phytohabitans]ALG06815.1 hypothetical protein AOZ06_07635 [Kibdelosporangium phytohabitans]MBE1468057.1 hypothetical protein [Kibdelosporangium phytohabitans]